MTSEQPTPHVCQFCDRPMHEGVCTEEAVNFFRRAVRKSNHTPRRTVRIENDVWSAAKQRAEERGENLSDVIRKALIRYVKRND